MEDRGADVTRGFRQRRIVVTNRWARQEFAGVIGRKRSISRRVVRIASAATSRSSSVAR
jgi:hypothetical protein